MVMRKEFEYDMDVVAFKLQSSDAPVAFPYVAPFSATVPQCCRVVRSFIEDSVSFLAHGAHMDVYDVVKRYLDRLLTSVLNEALLRVIQTPSLQVREWTGKGVFVFFHRRCLGTVGYEKFQMVIRFDRSKSASLISRGRELLHISGDAAVLRRSVTL